MILSVCSGVFNFAKTQKSYFVKVMVSVYICFKVGLSVATVGSFLLKQAAFDYVWRKKKYIGQRNRSWTALVNICFFFKREKYTQTHKSTHVHNSFCSLFLNK